MTCDEFRATADLAAAMAMREETVQALAAHRKACAECAGWLEKSDKFFHLRQRIERIDKPQLSFAKRLFRRR
jgi:hypothetical protein